MNEIKTNDKVICTDNSGRKTELTIGKTYIVLATDYSDFKFDGTFLIGIKNDRGDITDYGNVRFKTKKKGEN